MKSRILTALLATSALATSPALAQDTIPFDLGEIVLSTSLTPVERGRTGATVEVLEGRDAGGNDSRVIDRLVRLPGVNLTTVAKLAQLDVSTDASPEPYIDVIRQEPMLVTRLLGIANSSWASPIKPITRVDRAVYMLGLVKVHAMVLSFCLERYHNHMDLDRELTRALWEGALYKAAAAQALARPLFPDHEDDHFVVGLVQDIGVPMMMVVDSGYSALVRDPDAGTHDLLEFERRTFRTDHANVGGVIAQQLGLPSTLISSITAHHKLDHALPDDDVDPATWIGAAVALLPHMIGVWSMDDLMCLDAIVTRLWSDRWPTVRGFLEDVTHEYDLFVRQMCKESSLKELPDDLFDQLARATQQANANLEQSQNQDAGLRKSA